MFVARKIAYNVLVSTVSKVLSTVLALFAIGLITRYLGAEGFGEYATVLAFLSFFAAMADLGLYQISTREISQPGADEEKIMGNIFSLRLISALLIILLAPIIMSFFPGYSLNVKEGVFIVAVSFLFSSGYQVLNGVFQKNLAMDRVAIAEFVGKVVQLGFIFWVVKSGLSFSWIVAALLLNMVVSFFLVLFWSRKYIKLSLRFDFAYWKHFLIESFPIGLGAIIVFVYFKIDTIFLSVMKTSAEVGIYNAAYKVIENIIFFPAMIIGLVFPIMSRNIFHNRKVFLDISNKTFKVFVLLIVPLIVGGFFLADGIIGLIGGGQFVQSSPVLQILIFSLAAIFFGSFFNNILIAAGLQKKLMRIWIVAAILNVVLNYFLIPRFSYFAAAFISVLTEVLVSTLGFYWVFREVGYVPRVEKFWAILLSGLAMASTLVVFKGKSFFLLVFLSTGVYLFFLWVLRAVKTVEITSLISKKGVQEYESIS